MFDPKLDGVDHINIYSKGNTVLGRLLSNFTRVPFTFTELYKELGSFESIEGLWYWLRLYNHQLPEDHEHNRRVDELRTLWGTQAKQKGRELRNQLIAHQPEEQPESAFQSVISAAIAEKVIANEQIVELLNESSLPFVHYYVYGDKVKVVECKWLMDEWERARRIVKKMIAKETKNAPNGQ